MAANGPENGESMNRSGIWRAGGRRPRPVTTGRQVGRKGRRAAPPSAVIARTLLTLARRFGLRANPHRARLDRHREVPGLRRRDHLAARPCRAHAHGGVPSCRSRPLRGCRPRAASASAHPRRAPKPPDVHRLAQRELRAGVWRRQRALHVPPVLMATREREAPLPLARPYREPAQACRFAALHPP